MACMTWLLLHGPWAWHAVSTLLFVLATGYIVVAQLVERFARPIETAGPVAGLVQDEEFPIGVDTTPSTTP